MNLIVVIFVLATLATEAWGVRVQPQLTRGVQRTLTVSPSQIDPEAQWGLHETICKDQTWARGYKSWQDDSVLDEKGLTKIMFRCKGHGERDNWISTGHENGEETDEVDCCRHQYIVGVRVSFGGDIGAIELRPICEVPVNWGDTAAALRGESKPSVIELKSTIDDYRWEIHGKKEGWVMKEVRCPKGEAVCGVNANANGNVHPWNGLFTDQTGINEVKISCCWIPASKVDEPDFGCPAREGKRERAAEDVELVRAAQDFNPEDLQMDERDLDES